MLTYLNGVKKNKPAVKTKSVKPRTANVINKGLATPKGRKVLAKTPAGAQIVKTQAAAKKGLIKKAVAVKKIQQLAPLMEKQAESTELMDKLDKAVTNEIINDIQETPAPAVIEQEESQDIAEGVNEVNDPEFDTPGNPEEETGGADLGSIFKSIDKKSRKFKIAASKKIAEIDRDIKTASPQARKTLKQLKNKIGNTAKKIGLSTPRAAFLGLVKLNAFHLADKLEYMLKKNPNKLKELWSKKLGGDFNVLVKTIKNAKNTFIKRVPVSIGSLAAISTLITAASPIVIEIVKQFKKEGIPTAEIQTETLNTTIDETPAAETENAVGYYYY